MRQIPIGTKGTAALRVRPKYLANRFKDSMLPPTFATPIMDLVMETVPRAGRERGRHGSRR